MFFSWPSAATIVSTNSRKSQAAFLRSCKHTANLLPVQLSGIIVEAVLLLVWAVAAWGSRCGQGHCQFVCPTVPPVCPPTVENGGRLVKQTPND